MNGRPKNVIAASAVAVIGGIFAIAWMAIEFTNLKADQTIVSAAVTMLIAVLFFAMAGYLYSDGKGDYLPMLLIGLINVVVIAAFIITDVDNNAVFGGIALAIAIVLELLVLPEVTQEWIAYDRIKPM